MKKQGLRLLALVLALLLAAPASLAKEIEIFGDGSKKFYEIEDKYGHKWHYYDIYPGKTKRQDCMDSSKFIRAALTAPMDGVSGSPSQAQLWDEYGQKVFCSEGTGYRFDGGKMIDQIDSLKRFYEYHGELTQCQGLAATERAIRADAEELMKKNVWHSDYKSTCQFDRNAQLADISKNYNPDNDMTFYTLNFFCDGSKSTRGNTYTLATGTVFYDFQIGYLSSGKQLDNAAGAEKDIEKVKNKRGVKVDHGDFHVVETNWGVNNTDQTITTSIGLDHDHTQSATNYASSTKATTVSYMVGTEVKLGLAIPSLEEFGATFRTSLTTSWMSQTTNGWSNTVSDKISTHRKIDGVKLPPYTKSKGTMSQADGSYTVQYDYPIVLKYKVAQYFYFCIVKSKRSSDGIRYPVVNWRESKVYSMFGEFKDESNSFAQQGLFNRYDNRNNKGYEDVHCAGHPLDWKNIANSSAFKTLQDKYKNTIFDYVPFNLTGGSVTVNCHSFKTTSYNPVPVKMMGSIKTGGANALNLAADGTINLSASVPVTAYYADVPGEVEFYGFDDRTGGKWVVCDDKGEAASSEVCSIEESGGDWVLTPKKAGKVNIKYVLDEAKGYEMAVGEGEETEVITVPFKNADVKNDTMITVKVSEAGQEPKFEGKVEIAAPVEAVIGRPLDLTRDGPALNYFDKSGKPLDGGKTEFPPTWSVVGGNSDNISIKGNILTVKAEDDYKVIVTVGGVSSEAAGVTVTKGAAVTGVTLDKASVTLGKGDKITLVGRVDPYDAGNKELTWESMDENIATVDQNGMVKALATGSTSVVATTRDGGFTASCSVTVVTPEDGKALDVGKLALVKGKTFKLGTPGGTMGTWISSDASIASVDDKGTVKGVTLGETTLLFTVVAAKKGASFMGKDLVAGDTVSVPVAVRKKGAVVNKVTLPAKKITLAPAEEYAIVPALKPATAPDREMFYKCSDNKIALVGDNGVITGVSNGKATITATSASGKSAKITVTVTGDAGQITLSEKKKKLSEGQAFTLVASPVPEGLKHFAPVFVSSKPSVATVDAEGNVLAVAKGKTTITVYAAEGSKVKAACKVTVK